MEIVKQPAATSYVTRGGSCSTAAETDFLQNFCALVHTCTDISEAETIHNLETAEFIHVPEIGLVLP